MEEMIERKDVFRNLKCNFTQEERLKIGDQMANAIRERTRLESEFASIKKQYSSDIAKQEAEVTSLAERLNTGWEMRRVECLEVKDFNNGTVRVYRKDLGIFDENQLFIEERPMTAEERQMNLPLEGKEKEALADQGSHDLIPEDPRVVEGSGPEIEPGVEGAEATPEPPETLTGEQRGVVLETVDFETGEILVNGKIELPPPDAPEGLNQGVEPERVDDPYKYIPDNDEAIYATQDKELEEVPKSTGKKRGPKPKKTQMSLLDE